MHGGEVEGWSPSAATGADEDRSPHDRSPSSGDPADGDPAEGDAADGAPDDSGPDGQVPLRLLRPVLETAWLVARAGLTTLPAVEPPAAMRPLLTFAKLPPRGLATVREVLEGDPAFRSRVAAAADPSRLDRVSLLWVSRPPGWEAEVRRLVALADRSAAEASEDRAERHARRRLVAAEEARVRAEAALEASQRLAAARLEETGAERRARRAAEAETATLRDRLERALRQVAESTEVAAAAERRAADAASAAVSAEASLAALEAERHRLEAQVAALGRAGDDARAAAAVEAGAARRQRQDAGASVADAAAAAAALGQALARAAAALTGPPSTAPHPTGPVRSPVGLHGARPSPSRPPSPDTAPALASAARPAPRPRRRAVPVPHGMFDDSAAWAERLVRLSGVVVLVDGYNVSLGTWPDLSLPAQRELLVAALGELAARCGASVQAVFDASADEALPPPPTVGRQAVRVRFSAQGQDADEALLELIDRLPVDRPVVVVTDDRRVRREAEARGANPLSVEQLLGVLGRRPRRD